MPGDDDGDVGLDEDVRFRYVDPIHNVPFSGGGTLWTLDREAIHGGRQCSVSEEILVLLAEAVPRESLNQLLTELATFASKNDKRHHDAANRAVEIEPVQHRVPCEASGPNDKTEGTYDGEPDDRTENENKQVENPGVLHQSGNEVRVPEILPGSYVFGGQFIIQFKRRWRHLGHFLRFDDRTTNWLFNERLGATPRDLIHQESH